ncbi:MAG: aminotransferase class I/II-fold pyridoxal phosphate-dependent enzyme [candidate division Zixibacteria bacterium]|nr:aminotransferase class I/II-fold pyridoxal phosphate-dependent enzyme [candidate division Zixibacteria bacterium]
MKSQNQFSRRAFLGTTSACALSLLYMPGIGNVRADNILSDITDFYGRICYNENPLGPSPMALEAMRESVEMAHRYPDWFNDSLEGRIAEYHGLQSSNICAGAGATEIIRLIADAFLNPGDEMITATPTYTQMASEAVSNGATVINVPLDENYRIDLDAIWDAAGPNTKFVSLVNPNNPTATIIDKNDMEAFLRALPEDVITVVDEAYHDYIHSDNYESCIRYINEGYNVIVIRTFSKVFGLAGARIGYAIAPSELIGMIGGSQLFATVSRISHEAASAALDDSQHLQDTISLNDEAKRFLESSFNDMGLNYISSHTNFMMFDTGMDAGWVASRLAENGYYVRTGWGMFDFIRVSTGTMEEMQGFITALEDILGTGTRQPLIIPERFELSKVYPNPFNTRCTIKVNVLEREKVNLTIYNTMGRKVKSLVNGYLKPGRHEIVWDGKNYAGKSSASGVYIVNLIQGENAASKRISLIK